MREYLRIPAERIAVVPLGIDVTGLRGRSGSSGAEDAERRARVHDWLPWRGSRPRRGSTSWPTRSSGCGGKTGRGQMRLEAAGYLARGAQAVSRRACSGRSSGRDCWATSPITARSTGAGKVGVPARHRRAVGAGDLRRTEGVYAARSDGERRAGRRAAARRVHRDRRADRRRTAGRSGRSRCARRRAVPLWNDRSLRDELGRRGREGVRRHYTIESSH